MNEIYERILLLKNSPVFAEIPADDLRIVARELQEEVFFAGDRVFEAGDLGEHLYIVRSGRVGITVADQPGDPTFLARIGPGGCFGEMNLLDDLPRSATAVVLEDAHLLSLEKGRLRGLLLDFPEMAIGMLRSLSLRIRESNQRLAERSAGD